MGRMSIVYWLIWLTFTQGCDEGSDDGKDEFNCVKP